MKNHYCMGGYCVFRYIDTFGIKIQTDKKNAKSSKCYDSVQYLTTRHRLYRNARHFHYSCRVRYTHSALIWIFARICVFLSVCLSFSLNTLFCKCPIMGRRMPRECEKCNFHISELGNRSENFRDKNETFLYKAWENTLILDSVWRKANKKRCFEECAITPRSLE